MKEILFNILFDALKEQGFDSQSAHSIAVKLVDSGLFFKVKDWEYTPEDINATKYILINIGQALMTASNKQL